MTSHHDKIKQLTERLEAWDYKVDRLENRVKGMPDELRKNAQEKFQKIKDFQQLKEQELKAATEHAVHEIENSFDEILDTFKLLFEDVEMEVEVEGT